LGRTSYREAGGHRLARQYELDGIFDQLAEHFEETRSALNDLRDRLICLDDSDPAVEAILSASARLWS
jgi:FMN phosphatase YigB (HAD superfamily)